MIVSRWSPQFTKRYGGSLPDDYLCFDLETSGFSRDKDVILEWGHVLVRGRKPVNRMSLVFNWLEHEVVPDEWIRQQLRRVNRKMRLNGSEGMHVTPEKMAAVGVTPEEGLRFIRDMLGEVSGRGEMLVAHNGYNFDLEMIQSNIEGFLGEPFDIPSDGLFDTGAVAKASQLLDDPRSLPAPGETMQGYFQRITRWRAPGVKWNLDHCRQSYGIDVPPDRLHQAGFDAYVLHLLFEKYRELSEREIHAPPAPDKPSGVSANRWRRGQRNR